MSLLEQLRNRYPLEEKPEKPGGLTSAAVLVLLTRRGDSAGYDLLLTQRARHLNSHPGQVAFPGGKYEIEDRHLLDTVLRESHEEVGLPPTDVDILGQLPTYLSKNQLSVTPYIATSTYAEFAPSDEEIDSVFQVPLDFFLDSQPARFDQINRPGANRRVPVWIYENYRVWGMTAMILEDFIADVRKMRLEWRPQ